MYMSSKYKKIPSKPVKLGEKLKREKEIRGWGSK